MTKCGVIKPVIKCSTGCKNGWTIEASDGSVEVTTDSVNCKILIRAKALYEAPEPCCATGTGAGGASIPGPAGPAGLSVVGPAGPRGLTGLAGPTGTTGATGAAGTNGTDGKDGQDAILGKVKYVRPFLVTCNFQTTSSLPVPPPKLAQAWVEEAAGIFFVRTWAEPGVALASVALSYPTLVDAETAADAVAGTWNCP